MLPGYPAGVAATSPPYPTPRAPGSNPLGDSARNPSVYFPVSTSPSLARIKRSASA